jgi:hypothetical protein
MCLLLGRDWNEGGDVRVECFGSDIVLHRALQADELATYVGVKEMSAGGVCNRLANALQSFEKHHREGACRSLAGLLWLSKSSASVIHRR